MARHSNGSKAAEAARELRTSTMQGHVLDAIDIKILDMLQRNGRISNIELAKEIGLSPPPALRRTAVLEERGLIKGYHAELNPKMLGFEVIAFITVALGSQSQSDVAAFETAMQVHANIRECHALSGLRDFLIKGLFHDLTSANDFVRDVLLQTPNVRNANTAFSTLRIKEEPAVPLELVETKPSWRSKKLPPIKLRTAE